MFAATRVMAAGKAGLESLPYFVDALINQGIPQLSPWAADHNDEQIANLHQIAHQRRDLGWKSIYDLGNADIGVPIRTGQGASDRLLAKINPIAHQESELADNPGQLAAWSRSNLKQYCRDTQRIWDNFKRDHGVTSKQLAVVIPFCPEGPTSGTIGMYLGAAMRQHFAELGREKELVVWGIELCPPLHYDEAVKLETNGMQNAFRGYVARHELLGGLPVTTDPNDTVRWQPFDINIVFDGDTSGARFYEKEEREYYLHAMDHAAAQATVCLLKGAAGGDVSESTTWLKQGKRWNTSIVHVVSETAYNEQCRYLSFSELLPWNRHREAWDQTSVRSKGDLFLRRVEELHTRLAIETHDSVKMAANVILDRADQLRSVKESGGLLGFGKGNKREEAKILEYVEQEDRVARDRFEAENSAPDTIVPKADPFCINVAFPSNVRISAAKRMLENSGTVAISQLLGDSGIVSIRGRIESFLRSALKRSDCNSLDIDSQAYFETIISVSIESQRKDINGERLSPSREFMEDFLGSSSRHVPAAFNPLTYDLGEKTKTELKWRPKGAKDYVGVEYSLLTLARCRPQDRFMDVSTYDDLKRNHDLLVADVKTWREYGRYYGVSLPSELSERPDSSENDSPTHETNGQARTNVLHEIVYS